MKESWILEREKLEDVRNLALFYPCSGNDLRVPIEIFSPYVTDLWVVDRGYFSPGHQDTKQYGADARADKQRPVLDGDGRYEYIGKDIRGRPDWNPHDLDIEPCILSETYSHIQTGREIKVHRRRGYDFSAFTKEIAINKLGVFFYRGDSRGEGGSGNQWLRAEHLDAVFGKLIERGLLVIDGSGSPHRRGIYREIFKYTREATSMAPEMIIQSMKEVTDKKNRRYHCVGYAGMRYGPTMIWQVHNIVQAR